MRVLRRISAAAKARSVEVVAAAAASADDDAIDDAAAAAKSNWVTSEVTEPIATTVSRWGKDPHSRVRLPVARSSSLRSPSPPSPNLRNKTRACACAHCDHERHDVIIFFGNTKT